MWQRIWSRSVERSTMFDVPANTNGNICSDRFVFSLKFFLLSLVFHLIVASLRTLLKIVNFVSCLFSRTRAASQFRQEWNEFCVQHYSPQWHFIVTKHLSESLVRNLHERKKNSSINYSKMFIFLVFRSSAQVFEVPFRSKSIYWFQWKVTNKRGREFKCVR